MNRSFLVFYLRVMAQLYNVCTDLLCAHSHAYRHARKYFLIRHSWYIAYTYLTNYWISTTRKTTNTYWRTYICRPPRRPPRRLPLLPRRLLLLPPLALPPPNKHDHLYCRSFVLSVMTVTLFSSGCDSEFNGHDFLTFLVAWIRDHRACRVWIFLVNLHTSNQQLRRTCEIFGSADDGLSMTKLSRVPRDAYTRTRSSYFNLPLLLLSIQAKLDCEIRNRWKWLIQCQLFGSRLPRSRYLHFWSSSLKVTDSSKGKPTLRYYQPLSKPDRCCLHTRLNRRWLPALRPTWSTKFSRSRSR